MFVILKINGEMCMLDVDFDSLLLWVFWDEFGMIGIKFGCGIVFCGVCIVYWDGMLICFC